MYDGVMCRYRASPSSACHILVLILEREIINRGALEGRHLVTGLTEASLGTGRAEHGLLRRQGASACDRRVSGIGEMGIPGAGQCVLPE